MQRRKHQGWVLPFSPLWSVLAASRNQELPAAASAVPPARTQTRAMPGEEFASTNTKIIRPSPRRRAGRARVFSSRLPVRQRTRAHGSICGNGRVGDYRIIEALGDRECRVTDLGAATCRSLLIQRTRYAALCRAGLLRASSAFQRPVWPGCSAAASTKSRKVRRGMLRKPIGIMVGVCHLPSLSA
jgi:hypothetical protein